MNEQATDRYRCIGPLFVSKNEINFWERPTRETHSCRAAKAQELREN